MRALVSILVVGVACDASQPSRQTDVPPGIGVAPKRAPEKSAQSPDHRNPLEGLVSESGQVTIQRLAPDAGDEALTQKLHQAETPRIELDSTTPRTKTTHTLLAVVDRCATRHRALWLGSRVSSVEVEVKRPGSRPIVALIQRDRPDLRARVSTGVLVECIADGLTGADGGDLQSGKISLPMHHASFGAEERAH
jgi:hypothetical protein